MPDLVFRQAYARTDSSRRNKIDGYLRQEDKERSLLGDLLTRRMLLLFSGDAATTLEPFAVDIYGKPYLESKADLHFNLSHSGDWIVCAVGSAPLGIDVEHIRKVNTAAIANHYFSQEEKASLLNLPEAERLSFFYRIWTLKESYIKAIGKGLSEPLDQFTIRVAGSAITLDSRAPVQTLDTSMHRTHWHFRSYPIDPTYKLAVCAASQCAFPEQVTVIFGRSYCLFLDPIARLPDGGKSPCFLKDKFR
jgi:4'-phosphopantetheinyl transferase